MDLIDLDPGDPRLLDVWPVLQTLREGVAANELADRYAEGHRHGYRLTAGYLGGECVAVAGWRITTTCAHGRLLYVDDLVTVPHARSAGHGARLLSALEARAVAAGCWCARLDSGVQRHAAHRFYFREGYRIVSYVFETALDHVRPR